MSFSLPLIAPQVFKLHSLPCYFPFTFFLSHSHILLLPMNSFFIIFPLSLLIFHAFFFSLSFSRSIIVFSVSLFFFLQVIHKKISSSSADTFVCYSNTFSTIILSPFLHTHTLVSVSFFCLSLLLLLSIYLCYFFCFCQPTHLHFPRSFLLIYQ